MALLAYAGGGTRLSASLPRALNRKIQFLRLAFKKLPELQKSVNYAHEMLVAHGEDSKQFKAADKKADELKHLVNNIQFGLK